MDAVVIASLCHIQIPVSILICSFQYSGIRRSTHHLITTHFPAQNFDMESVVIPVVLVNDILFFQSFHVSTILRFHLPKSVPGQRYFFIVPRSSFLISPSQFFSRFMMICCNCSEPDSRDGCLSPSLESGSEQLRSTFDPFTFHRLLLYLLQGIIFSYPHFQLHKIATKQFAFYTRCA